MRGDVLERLVEIQRIVRAPGILAKYVAFNILILPGLGRQPVVHVEDDDPAVEGHVGQEVTVDVGRTAHHASAMGVNDARPVLLTGEELTKANK
jgi:hypothetical protein